MKRTLEERFWEKVDKNGPMAVIRGVPSRCWMWTASLKSGGYGRFRVVSHKMDLAHRVSYDLTIDRIPEDLELDHLCRNRGCVNPQHLEPVTRKVNQLRGFAPMAINARKQTCPRGHVLAGENLVRQQEAKGWRECRTCRLQKVRDARNRKAAFKKFLTSF